VSAGASPEIHHSHRDVTGGWLRPAVFGAMDGLVSNVALIAGVAGGGAARGTIALAGLAGLFAGAFSMAAGEYTSVAAQAELTEAEIAVERRELARSPDAERRELAQIYVSRGVDPALADEVARQISRHPEQALDVHVREELGVSPHDLPSAPLAAGSSFVSFALGALVPLLPYLVGVQRVTWSLIATAVALFACGAVVSRVTARTWWFTGLRQVVLGGLAAGATYVLGDLVGTGLG
jgi:VIT1/CCC1 family predicted Fe2+/Mn2+ transporter